MNLEEYRQSLLQEIRATANAENKPERNVFVSEIASMLENAEELEDFKEAYFEMQGPKKRKIQIDGYAFDELDECLTIILCDFHGEDSLDTITETEAKNLFPAT